MHIIVLFYGSLKLASINSVEAKSEPTNQVSSSRGIRIIINASHVITRLSLDKSGAFGKISGLDLQVCADIVNFVIFEGVVDTLEEYPSVWGGEDEIVSHVIVDSGCHIPSPATVVTVVCADSDCRAATFSRRQQKR